MKPPSLLEIIVTAGLVGLLLLTLWQLAGADEWRRAKPGTLVRITPEPRCIVDCPETIVTGPGVCTPPPCVTTTTTLPPLCAERECPECPNLDEPTEHTAPCPPCSVIPPPECLAREWEEKYLGAKNERDGLAAFHQREAADNRRCKKSLKKCRGRK